MIDWFWVKAGIKGGLAAVIAIVCLKWLHPPGSSAIPLMAWTLSIMGRPSLRAGGSGDLRMFQTIVCGCLILAVCAVLLLLTTPFLANYAVMNLALFLVLFAFGFLTARIAGINFGIQIAYLTISAFVALNPQEPVSSQTIIDTFIGIMFGMLIAAVVGRLLWPVLPQKVLRDNLLAVCTRINALLSGNPRREKILTQLANLIVEAQGAVREIRIAGCSENERLKLAALIHTLQMQVSRIGQLVSDRSVPRSLGEGGNLLPQVTEQIMIPKFEHLEIEFMQMLDAFAECFRDGDCSREFPTVDGALTEMDHAVQQIRDRNLLGILPAEASLCVLELVDRYHTIADGLERCGEMLHALRIERYWGDYGL